MTTGNFPEGKTFSILGDSYSTFQGHIPEKYQYYYPLPHNVDDVLRVEDTWWYQLAENMKMKLLVNNSFSGSTVCDNVREGWPASCAFTIRSSECDLALDSELMPDYIFVFGCTNDYWIGRALEKCNLEIGLLMIYRRSCPHIAMFWSSFLSVTRMLHLLLSSMMNWMFP